VITGRQALAVLSQVAPYLQGYKLERARLLLAEYVASTPRNGRYTAIQKAKRAEFERRFFAISTRARSMKSDAQKREPSALPVIDSTG